MPQTKKTGDVVPQKRGRVPAAAAEERNSRILDSATNVFLEAGYDRATMTNIAKRAGCSLETLYAAYPNKEVMFTALIARKAEGLFQEIGGLDPGRDLREGLHAYAVGILAMMGQQETKELQRLVIGACTSFPDLAKNFWNEGPGCSIRDLTDFFTLKADGRTLQIEAPNRAAEIFMALLTGDLISKNTLGLRSHAETKKQQVEWAEVAVDLTMSLIEQRKL